MPNNNDNRRRWTSRLVWTYNGCASFLFSFYSGYGNCLNDNPCRAGETDGLYQPLNNIMCQYPLNQTIAPLPVINLPEAWNTLEDEFFLHEEEFLLSSNKMYELSLTKGNLFIKVIFFLFYLSIFI